MSEYNNNFPDRPAGWTLANEGFKRVTRIDFFGNAYESWEKKEDSPSKNALWDKWRERKNLEGSGLIDEKKQQTLITIELERL